ncbi:MAG TPA: peptidylprolyl isomerase [Dehalococcoidales bacterium]
MSTRNNQPNRQSISTPSNRLPTKRPTDIKTVDKDKHRRRNTFITAVSISVVIILIISIAYYLIYVMPFQRIIIKVDNDVVKIDYFLKRALNSSSDDPIGETINTLVEELIILQEASKYGIEVSGEDIDTALHDAAKGDSESITDAEYKEWYRQLLNSTQFSDKQFRDLVKRSLLRQRMIQYMADITPTTTEQDRLSIIVVKTYEEALSVKERVDNGEEFASLARELSLDTITGQNGGDMGWFPVGILEGRFQYVLKDLDIGKCSEPTINNLATENSATDTTDYAVFMITEKDVAREVQPEYLTALQVKTYTDWLYEQEGIREIKYYSIHGGNYDDETNAWLNYQLQRMEKGRTSSSTE